jgi:hypothetical protein
MPCNGDHLCADKREVESRQAARHICYLFPLVGTVVPTSVRKVAADYYGDPARLDELTRLLCSVLKALPVDVLREYVTEANSNPARELAKWWIDHRAADELKKGET